MRYPRNAAGDHRRSGEARRRFRRGMNPTTLLLLYAFGAVVALIVLIARYKLHPFIALIAVSLALGIAAGMPFSRVVNAVEDGGGGGLGFISIVVALRTLLGKMIAGTGA